MKLSGMIACVALAVSGVGGAQAQSVCGQIVQLALSNHAQVKAMRGEPTSETGDAVTYRFKPGVNQFDECRISSAKAIDSISDYWEHHLWCEGEADTPEAATKIIESYWACTQDMFTERFATESWQDGAYRVIGVDGEVPSAGRESGPVEFGETDYAHVQVEKSYDTSDAYELHVFWYFVE